MPPRPGVRLELLAQVGVVHLEAVPQVPDFFECPAEVVLRLLLRGDVPIRPPRAEVAPVRADHPRADVVDPAHLAGCRPDPELEPRRRDAGRGLADVRLPLGPIVLIHDLREECRAGLECGGLTAGDLHARRRVVDERAVGPDPGTSQSEVKSATVRYRCSASASSAWARFRLRRSISSSPMTRPWPTSTAPAQRTCVLYWDHRVGSRNMTMLPAGR